MAGCLFVNPRSGPPGKDVGELVQRARARGIHVHELAEDGDLGRLAREADADALGMAGGDGSLALVADAAIERDLPFVCIPFGSRNHFARDIGLDRADPIAALEAFGGTERRIDVGRVGERAFLNNVSLGVYARLVHHREGHRRRRAVLARARALALSIQHRHDMAFTIDGRPVVTRAILVANNEYELDLFSIGERRTLDAGLLHAYMTHGILPGTWEDIPSGSLTIDTATHRVRAAIDGEPAVLETPIQFSIDPGALRVLVPERAAADQGAS